MKWREEICNSMLRRHAARFGQVQNEVSQIRHLSTWMLSTAALIPIKGFQLCVPFTDWKQTHLKSDLLNTTVSLPCHVLWWWSKLPHIQFQKLSYFNQTSHATAQPLHNLCTLLCIQQQIVKEHPKVCWGLSTISDSYCGRTDNRKNIL